MFSGLSYTTQLHRMKSSSQLMVQKEMCLLTLAPQGAVNGL